MKRKLFACLPVFLFLSSLLFAATVDIYVDPPGYGEEDGTTWGDAYASLEAAVAARAADIVTAEEIHYYHCRSSDGTADTTYCAVDGYTTSTDYYVIIEGDFAGTKYDATKYHREISNASALVVQTHHIRIRNIQCKVVAANTNDQNPISVNTVSTATDIRISHSYFETHANDGYWSHAMVIYDTDLTLAKVWNNILWQRRPTPVATDQVALFCTKSGSGFVYFYNNTLYGGYCGIERYTYGNVVAINNIVQGSSNSAYLGDFHGDSDYNISDDATDTGGDNDQNSISLDFVGGGDFALVAGDTEAIAGGADVDEDANCPVTDDIEGTARHATTPCIGAYEYVGAGGGSIVSLLQTRDRRRLLLILLPILLSFALFQGYVIYRMRLILRDHERRIHFFEDGANFEAWYELHQYLEGPK